MNPATDAFADWDAAYVLGALSARDRRAFERHLDGCPRCAAGVAELAGMPGLLGRVDVHDLPDASPELQPAAPANPHGPARPTRRVLVAAGAVLAAAATATVLAIGGIGSGSTTPPPDAETVQLASTGQTALSAEVRLDPEPWGTAVSTHCHYADRQARDGAYGGSDPQGAAAGRYGLYVTDSDGSSRLVSSWTAEPGSDVRADGSTDVPIGQITLVDIRSMDTDAVLLESAVSVGD
ncbi:MAG: zf-HC2 domain-containing protein [Leifsonia sp.]